jgi:hypothetical protein
MRTYRSLLRGDHLEWLGEAPEFQTDAPLSVHVTIVEPEPVAEAHVRGPAMVALLEKLAARGTFAASLDPVRWQRELRDSRSPQY